MVRQARLQEQIVKQVFHIDAEELFEPITGAVADASEKLLDGSKFDTKAIEELDQSNVHVKASVIE